MSTDATIVIRADSTQAEKGINKLIGSMDEAEKESKKDSDSISDGFEEIADGADQAAKAASALSKGMKTLGKGLKGVGVGLAGGAAGLLAMGAAGFGAFTLLNDSMAAWFERTEVGAEKLGELQVHTNQLSFSMFELMSGTTNVSLAAERAEPFFETLAQIFQIVKDRVMASSGAFGFMRDAVGAVALIVVDAIQVLNSLYGVLERAVLGAKLVIRAFSMMGASLTLLGGFIVAAGQTLIASLLEPFSLFSEKIAGIAARLGMDGVAGALRSVGEGTERMAASLRESALSSSAVAAATATISEGFSDLQTEGGNLLAAQNARAEALLSIEEDVQDAIAGQYESTQNVTDGLEEAVEEAEELEEVMTSVSASTAEIVENLRDISDYSDEAANSFRRMDGAGRELMEFVDRFNLGLKFEFTSLEQSRMDVEFLNIQRDRYTAFFEEQAELREANVESELEAQQKLTDAVIESENAKREARMNAFSSYHGIMEQSLDLAAQTALEGENIEKAIYEMIGGELQARGKAAMFDGALMLFSPNPMEVARAPGRIAMGVAAFAAGKMISQGAVEDGGTAAASTATSIGASGPTGGTGGAKEQRVEIINNFGIAQSPRYTAKAVSDAVKNAKRFGYA